MPTTSEFAAFLRRHTAGLLQAGDQRRAIRFVADRSAGALVAPLETRELEAEEIVLFVPDEGEGGAQVLVSVKAIEEGRPTDRWLAYHGAPDAPTWCRLRVEAARVHGAIVDDAVDLVCPFADGEPALCKRANAASSDIAALCRTRGVTDPHPVLVGVDADGFDVRTRTGLVRFDFDVAAATADAAREQIERMLAGAADASA